MKKRTLVLGASLRPERYSNLAVRRLVQHGHAVLAIGSRQGSIGEVPVLTALPDDAAVDTVTLYLNPVNQAVWRTPILTLRPKRVIFNPGTEDAGFMRVLNAQGIEAVEGCTLVMLAANTF